MPRDHRLGRSKASTQTAKPRSRKAGGSTRTRRVTQLFTVGYAGKRLEDFLGALVGAGVQVVLDVRELPLSRSRGFSKTPLRKALSTVDIEYVHMREAGNPFRHLAADIDRCLTLYGQHLAREPGVIETVKRAIAGRRAALLCVEADAARCHRSVLAKKLNLRTMDL
jgi:uncharacterized protein (DUF488 family)